MSQMWLDKNCEGRKDVRDYLAKSLFNKPENRGPKTLIELSSTIKQIVQV